MIKIVRKLLVNALGGRREYTEDLLRKLWSRETGGLEWDEVVAEHNVEIRRVKNMFDVLDERFGEDILSGSDEVARRAMRNSLAFMMRVSDEYRHEHEKKIIDARPSR